jgi:hypothetical protein
MYNNVGDRISGIPTGPSLCNYIPLSFKRIAKVPYSGGLNCQEEFPK